MNEQGSNGKRSDQMRQQLHAQLPQISKHSQGTLTGRLVFRLCDKRHGGAGSGLGLVPFRFANAESSQAAMWSANRRRRTRGPRRGAAQCTREVPARHPAVETTAAGAVCLRREVSAPHQPESVQRAQRFTVSSVMPHKSRRRAHPRNQALGNRRSVPGRQETDQFHLAAPPRRPVRGRDARRQQKTHGAAHR